MFGLMLAGAGVALLKGVEKPLSLLRTALDMKADIDKPKKLVSVDLYMTEEEFEEHIIRNPVLVRAYLEASALKRAGA